MFAAQLETHLLIIYTVESATTISTTATIGLTDLFFQSQSKLGWVSRILHKCCGM